jgi:hypothetical protein
MRTNDFSVGKMTWPNCQGTNDRAVAENTNVLGVKFQGQLWTLRQQRVAGANCLFSKYIPLCCCSDDRSKCSCCMNSAEVRLNLELFKEG